MSGDQLVGRPRSPVPRRVGVHRRRRVEQRLHDAPGLLDAVLAREALAVTDHRRVQEHFIGRRALTAFLGSERYYVVKSVDSNTQVTLAEPYEGSTAGGKSYTLSPLATAPRTSDFYAAGFNRLISCCFHWNSSNEIEVPT